MKAIDKIMTIPTLLEVRKEWNDKGLKVVFTNGCFDLLHLGHVDYLEKARLLGDKLILALNTDASVQRLKGPNRPITDQRSRAAVVASLQFVDAVVYFDEETPYDIITALKPDILVKGSDYVIQNIVGADFVLQNGGKVLTVELVNGYSTTNIVEKIKRT